VWHRRSRPKFQAVQPAEWVDALVACRNPAVTLIERNLAPGRVCRALGAARNSLREPREILPALQELRGSLAGSLAHVDHVTGLHG
jgi:hypothetical protein